MFRANVGNGTMNIGYAFGVECATINERRTEQAHALDASHIDGNYLVLSLLPEHSLAVSIFSHQIAISHEGEISCDCVFRFFFLIFFSL